MGKAQTFAAIRRGQRLIRLSILAGALFGTVSLFGMAPPAYAQVADQACDPEFMDAVEAKGWLDGQRQTAQNQNLIYKPDSVLEFTCFNQLFEVPGVKAAPRFSESPRWGEIIGIDEISTDLTVQHVVSNVFLGWLQANFQHTYRGGRLPAAQPAETGRALGDYVCEAMKWVWEQTRCVRFMEKSAAFDGENPDIDGFYEFTWYRDQDPRILPPQFASCMAPTENFNLAIPAAYNQNEQYHILDAENPNNDEPWERDPLVTHLQFILPDANCAASASPPAPAIPTGVTVLRLPGESGSTDYPEHVCLNPGCSWNGTECIIGQ